MTTEDRTSRVLVHRNPVGVGLPFHPRLRPLAAATARLLPRIVRRELERDPGALVIVASLLDEPLDALQATGAGTTAGFAAGPESDRRAAEAAFRMADGWHRAVPPDVAERFVHHGVDLAAAHRWDLHYPLQAMVDFLQRLEAILDARQPSRLVVVGNPAHVGIAGRLAARRNVPFHGRPFRVAALADRVLGLATGRTRSARAEPAAPASDATALFVTHGPSDAHNVVAVAAELKRRDRLRVRVLSFSPSASRVLRDAGVRFEEADAVARPPVPARALRDLRTAWKRVRTAEGLPEVFDHHGVDLFDPWAHDLLRRFILRRFPRALSTLVGAEAVLDRVRPRVVVTGFDPGTDSQLYVRAARRRGVPTLSVQDGTLVHADLLGLTADSLCSADDETARAMEAGRVDPHRVHVTGQPRHDPAPTAPGGDEAVRDRLGIPPDHRIALLFAATGMDSAAQASQKQRYEDLLVGHFAGRHGWTLLVKLHPQDDGTASRRVLTRHDAPHVHLVLDAAPRDLIAVAEVVLCAATSTTATEAVRAGKPLLLLDLDGEEPMRDLVEAGVARYARDPDAFPADLEATLHDPDLEEARADYLREHLPQEGRGACRVVDVLEGLARSGGRP